MAVSGHTVRVRVQTRRFRCEGSLLVPAPGGYKGRVLDLLNCEAEFFALTDVDLYWEGGEDQEAPRQEDVLILRKGEIQFVVPLD